MARPYRVVRDPVYGYVHLPLDLAPIVASPQYQRLRRIAQTSLVSMVYPSATGTRFEHGLGVMFLAGRAWRAAWINADRRARSAFMAELVAEVPELGRELDDHRTTTGKAPSSSKTTSAPADDDPSLPPLDAVDDERTTLFVELVRLAVMGVGLLHDIGHPPFSHVLEPFYLKRARELLPQEPDIGSELANSGSKFHEYAGLRILGRALPPGVPAPIAATLRKIYAANPHGIRALEVLHGIVAGEIDVDRIDYIMRDAQRAGTEFGSLDWERLVDAFELRPFSRYAGSHEERGFRVAPNIRAKSAAETMLLQRVQSYRWIIFHQRVVGSDLSLVAALESLFDLSRTPGGESFEPLIANFDYVSPHDDGLDRALPPIRMAPGQAVPTKASDYFREQIGELTRYMAATVDDSTVVRTLLDARLLAEALWRRGATQPLTARLEWLITYTDAALFRRKAFLPVWKSEAEFLTAAENMRGDLAEAVRTAATVLEESFLGNDAMTDAARELAQNARAVTLAPSPELVRWVVQMVLSSPRQLSAFERLLDETFSYPEGRWRAEYRGSKAPQEDDYGAVLWGPVGGPKRLADVSALVKAITTVEGGRNPLHLYLFRRHPSDFAELDERSASILRSQLAGHVMGILPQFATSQLPGALTNRADDRKEPA